MLSLRRLLISFQMKRSPLRTNFSKILDNVGMRDIGLYLLISSVGPLCISDRICNLKQRWKKSLLKQFVYDVS